MTDPVVRLGIGHVEPDGSLHPVLAAIRVRLAPTPSEWALLTSVAVTAVPLGALGWLVLGFGAGAVIAVGHGVVLLAVGRRASERHRRGLRNGLPVALEAIARDLRTGVAFRSAIARQADESGSMASHFRRVHAAIELGQATEDACAALTTNTAGIRDHQAVAGVLSMVSAGGRGSARALEEAARAARQKQVVRSEVRALVAQAESSLRVLAGLPIAFVGLGMLSGQAGATALFDTSLGRWCLAIGVALNSIGLVWMRALVRSVAT